jgi:hypothetical protein
MSILHLHLLLNHVPVIGAVFLVFLFAFAALKRDQGIAKMGLMLCVLLAGVTGAVYLTGGAAEEIAEKIAGVSERSISVHEEAAELSTIAFVLLGLFALGSLILFRRKTIPRGATITALLFTMVVTGMMAWTANLGGNIRHTELQTASTTVGTEHED